MRDRLTELRLQIHKFLVNESSIEKDNCVTAQIEATFENIISGATVTVHVAVYQVAYFSSRSVCHCKSSFLPVCVFICFDHVFPVFSFIFLNGMPFVLNLCSQSVMNTYQFTSERFQPNVAIALQSSAIVLQSSVFL